MKDQKNATFFVFLVSLLSSITAFAQPVAKAIIVNEGIGFSRVEASQVVAYDPVAAYEQHQILTADCNTHSVKYKGVTWCFSSLKNTEMFQAAAVKGNNNYVPFSGGHCALALSFGNLVVPGDPRTAIRIGEQLVLNGNFDARARFLKDSQRNKDLAWLRYEWALKDGGLNANE